MAPERRVAARRKETAAQMRPTVRALVSVMKGRRTDAHREFVSVVGPAWAHGTGARSFSARMFEVRTLHFLLRFPGFSSDRRRGPTGGVMKPRWSVPGSFPFLCPQQSGARGQWGQGARGQLLIARFMCSERGSLTILYNFIVYNFIILYKNF